MNTFFNLFGTGEAAESTHIAKKDSLELEVPNHKEDTSQGSEFLDDAIWETDPPLNVESRQVNVT